MNQFPVDSGSLSRLDNVNDLIVRIVSISNAIIYLLGGLAVLYIIYAVVVYFIKGKEGDENRKQAGMQIFWGIVGLFIILSLWGLVNILLQTFATRSDVPRDRIPSADFIQLEDEQCTGNNC